jgi:hypothetical protein
MAHTQKPDFVFRRNGRVHLNWRGRQFSRLLAAEVCASAVVMLDTPCSEVVWRVQATHSIRQFPLHFPSRASPCAITFQLASTVHDLFSTSCTLQDLSFGNGISKYYKSSDRICPLGCSQEKPLLDSWSLVKCLTDSRIASYCSPFWCNIVGLQHYVNFEDFMSMTLNTLTL